MAAPQISLTEFPQWEFLHWYFGLDAYTYTYASAITATAGDREATDQNNAVPSANRPRRTIRVPTVGVRNGRNIKSRLL